MTAGNWSDLMADAQAVLGGAAPLGGALALLFFFTFQYVAVVLQLNVITSVVADLFENEHASAGVHITEFDIVGEDGTPKSTVRVWMNDRAVGERSSVLNWDKVKIAAGLKRRLSTPRRRRRGPAAPAAGGQGGEAKRSTTTVEEKGGE